jgi:hypothetical protein
MGMLTIYCDDSGTSANNKVAVVAGYIGSVFQWRRFNSEWQTLLDSEGVKVMHRVNLETFHGEFKEWNPDRRTAFVKEAQVIIKRRTYGSLGAAVIKADFESVMPEWVQKLYGGPYGWCAQDCIVGSRRWREEHPHGDDSIDWVFEAGTEGTGQVMAMLDSLFTNPMERPQYRINSWTFAGKNVLPLQAADVVAYESFKHMENQIIGGGQRPIRASAKDLFRQNEIRYHHFWDAKRMEKWLDNWDDKTKAIAAMRPKEC